MKILLDPGHGLNTLGKRSPDGKFLEAIYNRDIAKRIVAELQNKGYDAELLVPGEEDISMKERVCRVNAACSATPSCPAPTGHPNVILISIHVNAAGNGTQWMNATGWSCYTCKGQTQSDALANCLYQAATKNFPGKRIRTDYARDGDPDWEENFYSLRKSQCTAVLSENFFMDNHSDLEYLQSRAGKQAIIDTHVEGINDILINKDTIF